MYKNDNHTHNDEVEEEKSRMSELLAAQAYTNAISGLNAHPYGYGYGFGGISREAFDGTVANANIEANRGMAHMAHSALRDGQQAIAERISATGDNTLNIIQNNALTSQLNGFRDFVTSSFNAQDRQISNLALQVQECCCETKAAIAAVDAKVECQDKVRVAEQNAKQSVLLEQLAAKCGS